MASYLQGVVDVGTQVQPTEPNLQFNAQIMQTKESAYKTNRKQVSDLYGSILNADMSRKDNIEARQEFFKLIQGDLKKMGSMDFSLQSNVDQASQVFKSVYTNKGILKDIVWTKNFNSQVERANSLKNCVDPEKCGGQYWEEGMKYMQYKQQEYLNTDSQSALSMDDVKYVPYNSTMDAAIKAYDAAKLKMTTQPTSDGSSRYNIKTTNGQQIVSPLSALFEQTIAKNPAFHDMYKVKSFVQRNDYAHNAVATGQAKDLNEGFTQYYKANKDSVVSNINAHADRLSVDLGTLEDELNLYTAKANANQIKQGSKEHQRLLELQQLYQSTQQAKEYIDYANKADLYQNSHAAMSVIHDNWDNKMASSYVIQDLNKAAETLAFRDYSVTSEEDKFALEQQKHANDLAMEKMKSIYAEQLVKYKDDLGVYDKAGGGGGLSAVLAANKAREAAEAALDPDVRRNEEIKGQPAHLQGSAGEATNTQGQLNATANKGDQQAIKGAKAKADDKVNAKLKAANDADLKMKRFPKYPHLVKNNEWAAADKSVSDKYVGEILKRQGKTWTTENYNAAVQSIIDNPDATLNDY